MNQPPPYSAPPPRKPGPLLDKYQADLVVGVFVLLIFGCCLAMSSVSLARTPAQDAVETAASFVAVTGLLGIVVAGVGITLSKRWGHLLACIAASINTILAIFSLTIAGDVAAEIGKTSSPKMSDSEVELTAKFMVAFIVFTIVLYAALFLFSWLRLTRKVGPPPT